MTFLCWVSGHSFFTDTLILPEINGPTEGLMIIYCAHIFTGIVGTASSAVLLVVLSGLHILRSNIVFQKTGLCFYTNATVHEMQYTLKI